MNYYDFHVRSEFSEGESSIQDFTERAKILGYKGICISEYFTSKKQIEKLREECAKITKSSGVEIFLGFQARTAKELRRLTDIRRYYDVLLVTGGKLNLNRKAVETPEVDILLHPELERRDSGLNHTMAKLARKNNVAIEIGFREILLSSKNTRSHIIHNLSNNVKLCEKFKTPIILCSGSFSHLQMKDPKVLISMGTLLGLELNESKKALSETPENIIKMIKERQSDNWVRPGVKVVE